MFEVDAWDIGSENEQKLVHGLFGKREVGKIKHKKNSKDTIRTPSDKKKNAANKQIKSFDIQEGDDKVKSDVDRPKKRKTSELETVSRIDGPSKKRKKKLKSKITTNENQSNRIGMEIVESNIGTGEKKKNTKDNDDKYKYMKEFDGSVTNVKKKKKRRKSNNKFVSKEKEDDLIPIEPSFKNIVPKQSVESDNHKGYGSAQRDSVQKPLMPEKMTEVSQPKPHHSKKSELQEKLKQKLESSRFRWINEQLYTIPGDKAFSLFKDDTSLFDVYHQGFRRQVEQWPVNPVDVIIDWIKDRSPSLVLADFGCGEAVISQSVPNKVHSFDLVAVNERVTACNMAKVPLESCSVDVAIFCLSLMGTDLESFLREAYRVLKPGGILKIAEVVSRMDTNKFAPALCQLGFKLDNMDDSNKMFILLDFIKVSHGKKSKEKKNTSDLKLRPCIYKRR